MAWYRRGRRKAKKVWRKTPASRWQRSKWRKKKARWMRRKNRQYKGVGWTPDHFVSPIDAVPFVGPANKVYRGYKVSRKSKRAATRAVKVGYRAYKSRRGRSSSSHPKGRKKRRGKYYYYRGKRIYR